MINSRPILVRSVSTLLAVAALKCSAFGADGTWNVNNSGIWSASANWAGGAIADGADSAANFQFNIDATRTVTLDSSRTIGRLLFQDLTTVSHDWVLSSSGGSVLTLDVTTGPATIAIINRTATINTVLAGTDGINVTGAPTGTTTGTLVLAGANTFSGGLTITGGVVQLNNSQAAGDSSNVITVAASTNTGIGNRLAISGNITIGNNIVVEPGAAPIAGAGAVQQVGTGQATVNGTITLNGNVANGGHFVGGGAVGNELVLNGAISAVQGIVAQRAGRVIYRGGGTGYNGMVMTGTALVGATDGISTAATISIGQSGAGTLDLNGFDQTVAGLNLGSTEAGNAGALATVAVGSRTLTLNGGIETRGSVGHLITGTGTVALGANSASFTVNDAAPANDLTISPTISGTAGFTKSGFGTLILNGNVTNTGPIAVLTGALGGNTTISGAVSISAGATLYGGSFATAGTISASSLSLDSATLGLNLGTSNDFINVTGLNGLSTTGLTTVSIAPLGGPLPVGTYNLIGHNGAIQGAGLAGLVLAPLGHSVAQLVDNGTTIALNITSTDSVVWTGAQGTPWDVDTTQNWKLLSNNAPARYIEGDDVIFNSSAASTIVTLDFPVNPSRVTFDTSAETAYSVSGFAGIGGTALLNKLGTGSVTLQTSNSYTGATTVTGGTLELDHDATGNVVLTGTSGVSIAAGANLKLTRDDGGFTFNRDLSGAGTVEVNPHSVAGGTVAHGVSLTGNNTGFTGLLRLAAPLSGTYRITNPTPTNLGSANVEVQSGAQLYTAANQTYTNSINITGTGFADTNGNIGALRLEPGSVWAGPVVVNGSARIGAHNGTATVSGNISGGDLTVNATNYNNSYTIIFTGTNSYGQTVIGGQNTQTAGVPSMRLNIGNGGTTGTLGAGNVTINGDGANGVLGFDRSNGYTLAAGQTITAAGSNTARTFIDFDTLGAGFDDNGSTITLGTATATGGNIRVAQARANAVASFSGAVTTGNFRVGTGATGGVVNFKNGANINANTLFLGEAANMGGTANQASGSSVTVVQQLRVGHFSTEQSTYNMNGGTLTLTGASPNNSPSTAGAGNATTSGDNNLNVTNPTTVVGGGIYLGIDGTGIFNHNNGIVTTNWIVLDNRGDTGPAANMNGLDQYNLTDGTLNIRSSWGIIGRNNSSEFNLKGGTVRVDNTGTGTGTGANITVPFDALIKTAGTSTLDTNGAGNGFTLTKPVLGNGTIALTGGGTINLNPGAGYQAILASLTGANPIVKLGSGTSAWKGSGSGYTGGITVSTGRLELPANLAAASISVADGAAIAGEPTVATVTLGTTTGSTLLFDPNTAGALTATSLTANGSTTLDFSTVPTGAAPWVALNYGTKAGAGTFAVANAANYRSATATDNGTGAVTVNVTTKNLTWTGTGGSAWDVNTTSNWDAGGMAEKFFAGDTVTFGDTGLGTITIDSQVSPWGVTVNSVGDYTFSGTGGITGPGGLTKSGVGTLIISTANSYSGRTAVNEGTLTFANSGNLGNGSVTNTLALSGGGRLNSTGAVDLGVNRAIAVGTGGGVISMTNSAAQTVTIPGNISGSGALTFTSGGAGAPVFYLTGDNSAFTGNVNVNSEGGGSTTLRLGSPTALVSGTVTLLNPISGANGAATSLDLNGYTLPATVPLVLNADQGAASYRSQVVGNAPGGTIDGAIQINGNAGSIVQFSSGTANGITLDGNITAGANDFSGSLLLRGGGSGTVNGTINLPNATLNKTDGSTWTINTTGNNWLVTNVQNGGSLKLGINNALPVAATLTIGQSSDNASSLLDLNGFNQEVANLTYTAGTGNSARAVTNTSATLSTLTVNNALDTTYGASTGVTGGLLTGNLQLVKNGAGTLTLAGANTFTGNVTVNSGTLEAGGATVTSLGSATTAGRTVTVNNGATLSFTTNNVFGNGVNNNNLPTVALNGATLTSTRYNVLGDVNLNGSTLTQEAIDSGSYEGFQFRGAVTVSGTAASTIATTNGKANHLGPDTTFNVADVTGSAAADLVISSPLRDQSGDFGNAVGGLTKTGPGTLQLSGTNTYTGGSVIDGGTLLVSGSIVGAVTANAGGTLAGTGPVGPVNVQGGIVAPGAGVGTLSTGAFSLDSNSTVRFELAQAGVVGNGVNDLISVTGNLTLDGTLVISELASLANGTYRLFNYTGTLNDQGLAIDGSFLAAHPGSQVSTAAPGEVNLVVIPEPTAITALLCGAGVLLGGRRFRRGTFSRA